MHKSKACRTRAPQLPSLTPFPWARVPPQRPSCLGRASLWEARPFPRDIPPLQGPRHQPTAQSCPQHTMFPLLTGWPQCPQSHHPRQASLLLHPLLRGFLSSLSQLCRAGMGGARKGRAFCVLVASPPAPQLWGLQPNLSPSLPAAGAGWQPPGFGHLGNACLTSQQQQVQ